MSLQINDIEKHTPLWRALMTHCARRVVTLRSQNDADLDPIKTAEKRGRIAAFKELLALDGPLSQVDLVAGIADDVGAADSHVGPAVLAVMHRELLRGSSA